MKRVTSLAIVLMLSLTAFSGNAASIQELVQRIDDAQSNGRAYMLRPEEITQLEDSSDPVAHYYLGLVYAEGDTPNTPRDQCKAAQHIYQSANAGYPFAQLYLAYASIWGIGVEHDLDNAFAWATQAQKNLIKIKLKNEGQPHQPYNYSVAESTLDSALKCGLAITVARGNAPEGSLQNTQEPLAAAPCLSDNKIVFEYNSIPNRLDVANSRLMRDNIKRDLLSCGPLNSFNK